MSTKKITILVADNDPQLLRLMARNLEFEGYDVVTAADGQQALEQIERRPPDLVLLDVMMPKMDGLTVCYRVREFSAVPIIIVAACGSDEDKVRGLDLGADDYLAKPFSVEELLARVRAVLRRSQFTENQPPRGLQATMTTGDLTVDFSHHQAMSAGKKLPLTPTEYRLLACLAQSVGRILPQETLLEQIWGAEYQGESHLLQVNVARLRHKLEEDPSAPRYILTKNGVGYVLALLPSARSKDGQQPGRQEETRSLLVSGLPSISPSLARKR